jgi:hypothetical protein
MQLTRFEMKRRFFDRPEIIAKIGAKKAAYHRNAGGYFQKTAQRSMRRVGKKGKPSPVGSPPRYHGNDPSLRTILYAYDADRTIIGPVRLNQKHFFGGEWRSGTVPQIQEEGGEVGFKEKFKPFDFASAERAFGRVRAVAYARNFGFVKEAVWRGIYGKDFEFRVDRGMGGIWVPAGKKRRDRFLTRVRTAKYEARPFMEPAAVKTAARFPDIYFGRGAG